ncbi:GNAT family N-acetyltransferase [Pseudarthrobacter sp. J64]|uniref:GNAT family N-acetyltransferase n=1 Tax=Pseudarthrobacter sp. J64 TaxID=3116485 RepID=UPI002E81134B|nr:GNAT family N-acetyltransferase [Pseudarthrobacter sp. J64]MEE2569016.1 GNAT family N-acetyltransferase [Pseudarthrobacter sp. J64]
MSPSAEVSLAGVNQDVLEQLLELALRDAAPDEVTPPLGGQGWNQERIDWFRAFHRAAADGLDGPAAEKTWAVLCNGTVAGSIRLKRAGGCAAETGIWLGRAFRGRGIGSAALGLVLAEARRAGLEQVTSHTTAGNTAARRLLAGAGAALTCDDGGAVSAAVVLPN